MKILYLLSAFPKISEKFILDEIIAVQAYGHEIEIIAIHDLKESLMHAGANRFTPRYFGNLQLKGVIEFVQQHKVDHIHSHFAAEAADIAHQVSTATAVPFSFTTHAFDLYKYLHPGFLRWCEDAKCVFTISEYNKRFMCEELGADPRKVVVVPCGVFLEELTPRSYSSQPFKIITACRFVEKKGLNLLIDACKALKEKGVSFVCEIVGGGDDAIARQINEHGLSQDVRLMGTMTHPEITDFFGSGSVFVLPCIQASDGDRDGIPVALMEAMALRIPVISTELSGIPELISNRENGVLVTPGSVDELVSAIIEVKENPALVARLRACSRERIMQSFNAQASAAKMLTALRFGFPELSDFDLPAIRFCAAARTSVADLHLEARIAGLSNIFNPSFYIDDGLKILAFRAIPAGDDRLTSYVVVQDKVINISAESLSVGCLQLIDPKIFQLGDEFWITFNSGYVASGNDLFVMKVYPQIEKPRKVLFSGRQSQERNWSFFSRNGQIYALYWMSPLKILRLKEQTESAWEFEEFYSEEPDEPAEFADLTVGTQLAEYGGKYYFMAHRKYVANGKKLYLGRSACFDFENRTIKVGKHWFAHSRESLHGDHIKHNNNLFSCTYFSGIQISGGTVKIGYGINDVDYAFSEYSLADFMGNDMAGIFGEIYEKRMWGGAASPKFYSGRGSDDYNTEQYRDFVQRFIQEHSIKSVLDLGCGDFRVGQLMNWNGVSYTGVDVVSDLISENNDQFARENISFTQCDIMTDELPNADLCLIRQVFQHLSNNDILAILPKLAKFNFVLITDGLLPSMPSEVNTDKPTDRYNRTGYNSGLYLELPPFNVNCEVVLSYPSRSGSELFRTLLVTP